MPPNPTKLAVDTGGTFTDVITMSSGGTLKITKVPSTPHDFSAGILDGVKTVLPDMRQVLLFIHGTTVATNAIVQKTGASTGIVCTHGFRDMLDIRRGNRSGEGMLRADWIPPKPLVPRRNRLSVTERIGYDGKEIVPLNEEEGRMVARNFKIRNIESIVISFLNSYVNPSHEQRMEELIGEEYPNAYVYTSSGLLPVIREFERTSTVVANGYVGPLMDRYLTRLERRCERLKFEGDLLVMQSHGGVMSSEFAKRVAVRSVRSGPAAGVIAAKAICDPLGISNLMSFDMGGTSTDVSLVHDGEIRTTDESNIEFGVPILFPSLLVESIGAGGGTIAWTDQFGNLKSGPQSAGADPGPACYGRGGREPTVTDAQVLLGRLDPAMFLGGRKTLQAEKAKRALTRLSDQFGGDVVEAARGVLRVTDSNMEKAMRKVSTERGFDPRDFSLVAFGGAGPMHCLSLAQGMNMNEVIIPPMPGLTSALGLLFADIKHDFVRTYNRPQGRVDPQEVEKTFRVGEATIHENLKREGFAGNKVLVKRKLSIRYVGGFEPYSIQISVPRKMFDHFILEETVANFTREHEREFGYSLPDYPVVVEMIGVEGVGVTTKPTLRKKRRTGDLLKAQKGKRDVYFEEGGFTSSNIYEREKLGDGHLVEGPAIIEQMDSTVVVPPDMTAKVDSFMNLRIGLPGRS